LVGEEDVFVFGYRDGEEQIRDGSQPLPLAIRAFDLDAVRRMGVEAAATEAVEHMTREDLAGFFIHLDADCLDDEIMPAVEYRLDGGLSLDELKTTLRIALYSGKAVGLEVTIYNPDLDEDGSAGQELAQALAEALGTSAPTV
jgi:arginase